MSHIAKPQTLSLDRLLACNPHLTLADILALWHWAGPSRRIH
jgi:hypothetical protein